MVEFESQKNDLTEDDIDVTKECLMAMNSDKERWLAFYNCGEHSGARCDL